MPKNLDSLLQELKRRKCLVTSILQMDDDDWRASIRKAGCFSTGHGRGESLVAALSDAWDNFIEGDAWSKKRKRRVTPPAKPSRKRVLAKRE